MRGKKLRRLCATVGVVGLVVAATATGASAHRAPVVSAPIADGLGIGTITNDEPLPSLSIGDVSQAEGNSGSSSFVFTASLSGPSSQTVTVDWSTADGTAVAPGDYASGSGTLSFSPGQVAKTAAVQVSGDVTYENDFRSCYARVIDNWLGGDSVSILGGNFKKASLNFV